MNKLWLQTTTRPPLCSRHLIFVSEKQMRKGNGIFPPFLDWIKPWDLEDQGRTCTTSPYTENNSLKLMIDHSLTWLIIMFHDWYFFSIKRGLGYTQIPKNQGRRYHRLSGIVPERIHHLSIQYLYVWLGRTRPLIFCRSSSVVVGTIKRCSLTRDWGAIEGYDPGGVSKWKHFFRLRINFLIKLKNE